MAKSTHRSTPPDEPPQPDLTGKVLSGDFAILRKLGQGGMGQVYVAEQISLKRKVALKVLKPELAANEVSMKRFRNEAQAVARATHANIVQVYAIQESDGFHYMALEFVDGFNLREYLSKKGPPEIALALTIMRQVASALARAAELGIVHRDIKPENILLTRKAEVKVADFGLSRCFGNDNQPLNLTASGVAMGTPLYMSPEQVQGLTVDPRTDIYSFGVTCYHMLGGAPPFQGTNAFEVAVQHVQSQPTPLNAVRPDLPAELCALVDKMMAKAPPDRYQTARDVLNEIARIKDSLRLTAPAASMGITALPIPASPTSPGVEPRTVALPGPRRGRGRAALMLLTVAAALVGGLIGGWFASRPSRAAVAVSEEERLLLAETCRKVDSPEAAVRTRMNLGLYYLDHGRTGDADAYFRGLANRTSEGPVVQDLGQLGQALVLAQQNKAYESVQAFREVRKRLESDPARSAALFENRSLRSAVARALERNYLQYEANKEAFPADLDRLRHPGKLKD
jgi:tRNA A-37 threonylcarbamoyl transferase component Bud32